MISGVCTKFHCFIFIICVNTVASTDIECYTEPNGTDYRGVVNVTSDGLTCQNWNSEQPYRLGYRPTITNGLGDHNYCRNPGGEEEGVWCFATDPNITFQLCNIGEPQLSCNSAPNDTECYTEPNGTDYRGVVNVTELSTTCQKWTSFGDRYAGLGEHNYCRNPTRDEYGVWCFTSTSREWEYCDIGYPQSSCNGGDTTSMSPSSTFSTITMVDLTTTTSTGANNTSDKNVGVPNTYATSIIGPIVGVLISILVILIIAGTCIVYRKRQTHSATQSGLQYDGPYELGSNIASSKTPETTISGKSNGTLISDDNAAAPENAYTEIPENMRSEPKSSDDNGWRDNSVYASADNNQEGWKDNEIYASED